MFTLNRKKKRQRQGKVGKGIQRTTEGQIGKSLYIALIVNCCLILYTWCTMGERFDCLKYVFLHFVISCQICAIYKKRKQHKTSTS